MLLQCSASDDLKLKRKDGDNYMKVMQEINNGDCNKVKIRNISRTVS